MIDRGVRTRGEGGEALVTLVIFVTILYRHEVSNMIMLNIFQSTNITKQSIKTLHGEVDGQFSPLERTHLADGGSQMFQTPEVDVFVVFAKAISSKAEYSTGSNNHLRSIDLFRLSFSFLSLTGQTGQTELTL